MEGEGLVVEGQADHLHRLIELLAVELVGRRLIGVVEAADVGAERLGLTWHRAPADTEDAPTAADVVQGGEVLGQLQGVPLGNDVERHADPEALGALGEDGPDEDPVGDDLVALVLEVVLGEPVRVEPALFGHHAHVDDALGRRPDVLVAVPTLRRSGRTGADAAEEEDPSSHGATVGPWLR